MASPRGPGGYKGEDYKYKPLADKSNLIAGRFKTLGEYRAWQRAQARNKLSPPERPSRGPGGYKGREQATANFGEGFPDLANRLGVDVQDLVNANPDTSKVSAGATYNVPPKFSTPDYETSDPQDVGGGYAIQFPDYWNPSLTSEFVSELGNREFDVQGAYGARYWNPSFEGVDKADDLLEANKAYWEKVQDQPRLSDYGTAWSTRNISEDNTYSRKWEKGEMFQIPGLPMEAMWEKDPVTGEAKRKPKEAIFDALYVMNGYDPENDADVEEFWSYADDDLLAMGEFFDVIEWPSGGYGGGVPEYGYMPTPSRQYGQGQKPVSGDYASYLSLTNWSI